MNVTLYAPAGISRVFAGDTAYIVTNGQVTVPDRFSAQLLNAGFTLSGGGGGVTVAALEAIGYGKNVANGVLGLNAAQEAVAKIVPRTNTLANLLALNDGNGEMAVAVDDNSLVVQFPASQGGTQRIRNPKFHAVAFAPTPGNYTNQIQEVSGLGLNPRFVIVIGGYEGSPTVFWVWSPSQSSQDGFEVKAQYGGYPPAVVATGDLTIATPNNLISYVATPSFTSWGQLQFTATSNDTAAANFINLLVIGVY